MGNGATPPASRPASRITNIMANRNGASWMVLKWVAGIVAGLAVLLIGAVIVGGAGASIKTSGDVRVILSEQTMMKEDISQLKADVRELDRSLVLHRLETPPIVRGGGG